MRPTGLLTHLSSGSGGGGQPWASDLNASLELMFIGVGRSMVGTD